MLVPPGSGDTIGLGYHCEDEHFATALLDLFSASHLLAKTRAICLAIMHNIGTFFLTIKCLTALFLGVSFLYPQIVGCESLGLKSRGERVVTRFLSSAALVPSSYLVG